MGWIDNFNSSFGINTNTTTDVELPEGSVEDTKYWIYYAWGQLNEHDSSIPDDVLNFMRDASLYQLEKKKKK